MCVQSKGQNEDEERQKRCVHTYEIKNDVGRACSLCGLIKDDIKDMSFYWRRPVCCSVTFTHFFLYANATRWIAFLTFRTTGDVLASLPGSLPHLGSM